MTTILLTGGTGYLGSHLLKTAAGSGYEIILLKRSSSILSKIGQIFSSIKSYDVDKTDLNRIFEENRIDMIVHSATNYGRSEESPSGILEANLLLPLRLLMLGIEHGTGSFLNTDTLLDKRISHYSLSKSQFRDWLKLYSSRIACLNVSLEHFFGPGDDPSKFVTSMIHKMLNNEAKIELTPGEQKRGFLYIDDVASAIMAVISAHRHTKQGFYNYEIGDDRPVTIKEICGMIQKISGSYSTKLDFGALKYRDNEVMEPVIDLTEIKKLGWKPAVPLEQGLAMTIESERTALKK